MNEELTISGKKLLSIKEVVGRTKYTRDYVAKLARDGSIVGVQVGRQWFIDEESLTKFAEVSELELRVRRRQLSSERRREREVKEVLTTQRENLVGHSRYSLERGLAKTVALLVCGCVTGYALYALPVSLVRLASSHKTNIALVQSWLTGNVLVDAPVDASVTLATVFEEVRFQDTLETERIASSTEGILLLPIGSNSTSTADVAALFSDPVVVTFTENGAGVVFTEPKDKGGAGSVEVAKFVTVPLKVVESVSSVEPNKTTQ